jgi:hypothetical protein
MDKYSSEFLRMVLSGEINRITGQNVTIMLVRVLSEVLMDLNKLKKRVAELEENLNENANINEIMNKTMKGDQK